MSGKALIKVLHLGAHEELMMNYYRNFESGRVRFDFVLQKGRVDFRFKTDPKFDGRLFYVTSISESIVMWIVDVVKVLRAEQYAVVHMHLGFANIYGLLACLFAPTVKVKICHSHSYYESHSFIAKMFRLVSKISIHLFATARLACSIDAGKQMFYKDFTLIRNVIDYDRYKYNEEIRYAMRKSLGYEGSFVIGHIGNFSPEKNHSFLMDVFVFVLQKIPEARLLLVGADYGTMEKVINKSKNFGIGDKVAFTGVRSDVPDLLQAMDCFVFPSLFEGLPLSLLEAQVSGLKCFYSSVITSDAVVNNSAIRVDISEGPLYWSNVIHQYYLNKISRFGDINLINRDFDAASKAKCLENVYLGFLGILVC